MESFEKYQKQLLDLAQSIYLETPISEATQKAYFETPRHRFVKRYREWGNKEWLEVNEENLKEHLATLYADKALILFGDDKDVSSTISQPSFVLRMLDMLRFERGQKVFELGAGSGWNAALMGNLVGPAGRVYSLELVPEMARTAAAAIESLGIKNVNVIEGDGGEGYAAAAPYDRAIFTAGAYDLPHAFFEQIKEAGLLLVVIKNEGGGGDSLFLLQKVKEHFESIDSMPCAFVQMKGKYQLTSLDPVELEKLPEWSELKQKPAGTRRFWWGGKGKQDFGWRTLSIRSFLGIVEPTFRAFKIASDTPLLEEYFFGLWDQKKESLVLAKDDSLLSYGSSAAEERLLQDLEQWVKLGMPGAASFALQIFPADSSLTADENQWIVKRRESQFLWSLKK